MMEFFKLFRRKGFHISLFTLYDSSKGINKMTERNFFDKLKKNKSYLNDFYRSKDKLLKLKLIEYQLDENYDKEIVLTSKGRRLCELITLANEVILDELS